MSSESKTASSPSHVLSAAEQGSFRKAAAVFREALRHEALAVLLGSLLALARAALDAQEFALVRDTLAPLLAKPTQRVAMLMAELEEVEHGDVGRAREWIARAVRAPHDPACRPTASCQTGGCRFRR